MAADWSKRGEYIIAKHQTTPEQANEALADPEALVLNPDPASRSGVSARTIGYSPSRAALLTVITVDEDGTVFGINAWRSNDTDQRKYNQRSDE